MVNKDGWCDDMKPYEELTIEYERMMIENASLKELLKKKELGGEKKKHRIAISTMDKDQEVINHYLDAIKQIHPFKICTSCKTQIAMRQGDFKDCMKCGGDMEYINMEEYVDKIEAELAHEKAERQRIWDESVRDIKYHCDNAIKASREKLAMKEELSALRGRVEKARKEAYRDMKEKTFTHLKERALVKLNLCNELIPESLLSPVEDMYLISPLCKDCESKIGLGMCNADTVSSTITVQHIPEPKCHHYKKKTEPLLPKSETGIKCLKCNKGKIALMTTQIGFAVKDNEPYENGIVEGDAEEIQLKEYIEIGLHACDNCGDIQTKWFEDEPVTRATSHTDAGEPVKKDDCEHRWNIGPYGDICIQCGKSAKKIEESKKEDGDE